MNDFEPSELVLSLAADLVDGGLDEANMEQLRGLIAADPRVAAWFVEWMEINSILAMDFGNRDPLESTPAPLLTKTSLSPKTMPSGLENTTSATRSVTSGRVASGVRRSALESLSQFLQSKAWHALAACLVLGMAYLLGLVTPLQIFSDMPLAGRTPGSESAHQGDASQTFATIAGGINTKFAGDLSLGSRLSAGPFRLERGVARLVFDSGAVIVLEGPAELELVDSSNCRLVQGSLSADVMPEAIGFSVAAGGFEIAEGQAQFGLRTGPQLGTELHAFGGEVNLVDFRGPTGERRRLGKGEAMRWEGVSLATGIEPDPSSFVSQEEFSRRLQVNRQRAYQGWLEYSQQWLDDPSVILRYDFGHSEQGVLTNTVDPTQLAATSSQLPRFIAGRWDNKRAMLFDGRTDVLDVSSQASLKVEQNLSLAVWLRVRSYGGISWTRIVGKGYGCDRNYGLWLDTNGELLWQVCPDEDPKSQLIWDRYSLRTKPIEVDQWHLVVGVINGDTFEVYVNGELEGSTRTPDKIAMNDDPLTIGFYDEVPNHNGYFCGELDELILLNRSLSADEVQQMYEAGKQQFEPDANGDAAVEDDAAGLHATI